MAVAIPQNSVNVIIELAYFQEFTTILEMFLTA